MDNNNNNNNNNKHPHPQPQPQPQPYPYPYPYPYPPPKSHRRSSSKLSSCILAIVFLVVVVLALALVFFLLFRPKDPDVRITAVSLPGFSALNGTVSFTFAQRSSVRNPNRASFSHFDSSIDLAYRSSQVGFMYIPAGEIAAGRTQFMEASFAVAKFPVTEGSNDGGGEMEVETRMRVKGRVRVLRFFMHRVEVTAKCKIGVQAGNGDVIGVKCSSL